MDNTTHIFNKKINENKKSSIFNTKISNEDELRKFLLRSKDIKKYNSTYYRDNQKNSELSNTELRRYTNRFYIDTISEDTDIDIPQLRYDEYIQELLKVVRSQKILTKHLTRYFMPQKNGYIITSVVILDKYKERPVILSEIIYQNKICKQMFYDLYNVVDTIQDCKDLSVKN